MTSSAVSFAAHWTRASSSVGAAIGQAATMPLPICMARSSWLMVRSPEQPPSTRPANDIRRAIFIVRLLQEEDELAQGAGLDVVHAGVREAAVLHGRRR